MPRFSNNNNTYTYPNNITIIGHRILYANLAGLLMHCPGLVVKWEYEDLPEYIQSICGASVEGCFLVSENIFILVFKYINVLMMNMLSPNQKRTQKKAFACNRDI